MQGSDGNCGGVGGTGGSLSVDRRSYLKLAGVAAGSMPVLSGTASAAFTRRGIRFERSVDMVADAGCDPTGQEPCDEQIQDAADSFTLLRFPPGEYKVTQKNVILNETNLGFLGEGDVRFRVPERFNEKVLVVDSGTGVLFENIDIDQRADGATPALHLGGEDDIQVHDVELIGQGIHPDSIPKGEPGWSPGDGAENGNPAVMDFFYPIVRSPDGTGLVTNLTANNHGLMGAYNAGSGRSGIWVGIENRGTVTFRDCHIEEFGSNGTYTSRTNGVVQFEGGVYRNNDNNQIRIGSTGSYIDGATLSVDADASDAPNPYEALNYRGVRVEMGRQSDRTDVVVRDCDIAVRSAPHSGGGVVAEATASEFTVRNSRIGIDEDGVRGVLGKEPDGGGAYDPPAKPHAATLENVSITGSADGEDAITLFDRPDSVVDGCCIHQEGSSRNGVRLVDTDDSRVTDSTIDVTGQQVVEENSSVRVNDIDASGSCPVPNASEGSDLPHELSIEGTGGWTDYSFMVSGGVDPIQVNDHDNVRSSGVDGHVGGGTDRYAFSGELLAFDLEGEATITLDGEPAHVGQRPDHVLTIEGTGGWTDYSFMVSGGVDPIQANGHDTVRSDGADGYVGSGYDQYAFSGELLAFDLGGKANVTIDGAPAHVGQRPEHVLTIKGTGGWTKYSFTASGGVDPIEANGHDTVRSDGADGYVGSGYDQYAFSGELVAFDLNGRATVTLDGEPAHVGRRPDHVLTIEGTGGWTNYSFTANGSVEPIEVDAHDTVRNDGANGYVGEGTDQYAFSGAIARLEFDYNAHIKLNRSKRTITITGEGPWTHYRFRVSGSVTPIRANNHDDIHNDGVNGFVGEGRDVYRYSGELRSLMLDGTALTIK
jgi:hypothetical protein